MVELPPTKARRPGGRSLERGAWWPGLRRPSWNLHGPTPSPDSFGAASDAEADPLRSHADPGGTGGAAGGDARRARTQAGATGNLRVGPQAMWWRPRAAPRLGSVIDNLWWDRSHGRVIWGRTPVSQNPLRGRRRSTAPAWHRHQVRGQRRADVSQGTGHDQSNAGTIVGDLRRGLLHPVSTRGKCWGSTKVRWATAPPRKGHHAGGKGGATWESGGRAARVGGGRRGGADTAHSGTISRMASRSVGVQHGRVGTAPRSTGSSVDVSSAECPTLTQFGPTSSATGPRHVPGSTTPCGHPYAPRPEATYGRSALYLPGRRCSRHGHRGSVAVAVSPFGAYDRGDRGTPARPEHRQPGRSHTVLRSGLGNGHLILVRPPRPSRSCQRGHPGRARRVHHAVSFKQCRASGPRLRRPRRSPTTVCTAWARGGFRTGFTQSCCTPPSLASRGAQRPAMTTCVRRNQASNPDRWTFIPGTRPANGPHRPSPRHGSTYVVQLRTIVQTDQ